MRRWGSGEDAPSRARRWLPILGLAVLALEVGLVVTTFVPVPHNGGDNAGYVTLATSLLDGGYADLWDSTAPPHTKYPPVFPALLAGLIAAGNTTWASLKAVPVLFTVLSVLLAYAWAAGRRGPFFGAAVAALTGVSGAFLWSSRWILSDPTFVAFTFFTFWALDRADGVGREEGEEEAGEVGAPGASGGDLARGWLVAAGVAAILAYFTRSAGLPLLVALGAWLGLRRKWTLLAGFGVLAGLPAAAWWLRARAVGTVQYAAEFWMVDPYRPELGRVGPGGLAGRVAANLQGYVGTWIPEGLVGGAGPWVTLLGLLLAALAVTGWARRLGRRPGGAELFLPLYAGLILLWPEVWSGDRFALPLFPLLLFYAGEATEWAAGLWGQTAARVATAAAVLAIALPAASGWMGSVREATACTDAFRAGGTWACHGPAWESFAEAARWAGANLPPGAAMLSRKPRLFYVQSGVPGRTYPFTTDPESFFAEAGAAGARYVLLDYLDAQGTRYLGGVIRTVPAAFCVVRAFPSPDGSRRTQLLGLVPPDAGLGGGVVEEGGRRGIALPPCPSELVPETVTTPPVLGPGVVPLLVEGAG